MDEYKDLVTFKKNCQCRNISSQLILEYIGNMMMK